MNDGKIVPKSGKFFASATERTQSRKGIQQEIIGRVQCKLAYEVTTLVRIFGNNVSTADVRATLWVQTPNLREQYIGIAKTPLIKKIQGLQAPHGATSSDLSLNSFKREDTNQDSSLVVTTHGAYKGKMSYKNYGSTSSHTTTPLAARKLFVIIVTKLGT
ncbi:hypothetical protein JHK86_035313 [Glycine max]|nr:hypothetical protein JHK86_035313 [Glycine max]